MVYSWALKLLIYYMLLDPKVLEFVCFKYHDYAVFSNGQKHGASMPEEPKAQPGGGGGGGSKIEDSN